LLQHDALLLCYGLAVDAVESGAGRVRWSGWEEGCVQMSVSSAVDFQVLSFFPLDALCRQYISVTFVHERLQLSFHGKVTQIRPFFQCLLYLPSHILFRMCICNSLTDDLPVRTPGTGVMTDPLTHRTRHSGIDSIGSTRRQAVTQSGFVGGGI
jgi:hypothetical protein